MPRRASKWVLHETKNGWDLSRGGRYLYNGLGSKGEALKRLKNHYRQGEPVILEDQDGHQRNITQALIKAGII